MKKRMCGKGDINIYFHFGLQGRRDKRGDFQSISTNSNVLTAICKMEKQPAYAVSRKYSKYPLPRK